MRVLKPVVFLAAMTEGTTLANFAIARAGEKGAKSPSISESHPILGRWHFDLPNRPCSEDVEFRSNGTQLVTSGQEKARSKFTISAEPDADGFYEWTDTVLWTNEQPDCTGHKMPVGDVARGFAYFSTKKDQLMECRRKDRSTCWGPYVKKPDISVLKVN